MKEKFDRKNALEIPKIEKVVVNAGVGRLSQQPNFEEKILPEIIKELSLITGQRPAETQSKQSIAGFKIREGQIVGLKITLRGKRMNDFIQRIIKAVLPRIRDFRGIILKNIDSRGNLNIGLRDQMVFPEINPEESKVDFGLQISIVCNAQKREEAIELYKSLGFPLKIK